MLKADCFLYLEGNFLYLLVVKPWSHHNKVFRRNRANSLTAMKNMEFLLGNLTK